MHFTNRLHQGTLLELASAVTRTLLWWGVVILIHEFWKDQLFAFSVDLLLFYLLHRRCAFNLGPWVPSDGRHNNSIEVIAFMYCHISCIMDLGCSVVPKCLLCVRLDLIILGDGGRWSLQTAMKLLSSCLWMLKYLKIDHGYYIMLRESYSHMLTGSSLCLASTVTGLHSRIKN